MLAKRFGFVCRMLVVASLLPWGCATRVPGVEPQRTAQREIEDEPPGIVMHSPSVLQLKVACDQLARDLARSSLVQGATEPIVIEIRPMVDKTDQGLDVTTFPQMIREKLVSAGIENIVFRDEEVREDIIEERIEQSDSSVHVRSKKTSEIVDTGATSRRGKYTRVRPGTPFNTTEEHKTTVTKDRDAEVSSKIAEVDYFLKGFIERQDERTAGRRDRGYRYYRFQFRLTNARDGTVAWERYYDDKRFGALSD